MQNLSDIYRLFFSKFCKLKSNILKPLIRFRFAVMLLKDFVFLCDWMVVCDMY